MPSFLDMFRKYFPDWNEVRNKPADFAPEAHASAHENAGTDEISVTALSGTLADEQNAGAIKGVVVNDAAKADQKVLAWDEATDRVIYITPAPPGASIVSIQTGYISLSSGESSDSTLLGTEVDLTQSVCMFIGLRTNGASPNNNFATVKLSDSTHVLAERIGTNDTIIVGYQVIEFSGLTSVQQKTLTIPALDDQNNESITEVDLSKALLFFGGYRSADTTTGWYEPLVLPTIKISLATVVTGWRYVSAGTVVMYINFTVIEFP